MSARNEASPDPDAAGRGSDGRLDGTIREELRQRLVREAQIDLSDVEVMIVDGQVLLTGAVETAEVKRQLEDVARDVSGVRGVDNQLRVGLVVHAPHPDISADDFDMPWPGKK